MTPPLDKAVSEAAKRPEPEQDALAATLLAEIELKPRRSESFARPRHALAADTCRGTRASFSSAATPERARVRIESMDKRYFAARFEGGRTLFVD